MRKSLLAAAAFVAATLPGSAQAATVVYGFNLLAQSLTFDPRDPPVLNGIRIPDRGTFSFDTTTNQLLSFNYSFGPPLDFDPGEGFSSSPSSFVIDLFNAAGPCDLNCFVQTLNLSSYSYDYNRNIGTLAFAAPLSGSVTGSGPGAPFARPILETGVISVAGAIPEPGTWALMLFGFGAIGIALRKRREVAFA